MKKLLVILFLVSSYVSFSQGQPTALPTLFNGKFYEYTQYLAVDSGLFSPRRDTTFKPKQMGCIVVRQADSIVYVYNGSRWLGIGIGGGAGVYNAGYGLLLANSNFKVDTLYITSKQRLMQVADSLSVVFNKKIATINYTSYFKNKNIYFYGNSITYGGIVSDIKYRWTTRFSSYVGATEINRGIPGSTLEKAFPENPLGGGSKNFVSRMDSVPIMGDNDALLAISYGQNDVIYTGVNYTPQNYEKQLDSCINIIINNKNWSAQRILIIPSYYMDSVGYATAASVTGLAAPTKARHLAFIEAGKRVATKYGTLFLDAYTVLKENGGDAILNSDGIHPNDTGHAIIANAVLKTVGGSFILGQNAIIDLVDTLNAKVNLGSYQYIPAPKVFGANTKFLNKIAVGTNNLAAVANFGVGTDDNLELDVSGGDSYITAYNRNSSTWKDLYLRAKDIYLVNNSSGSTYAGYINTSATDELVAPEYIYGGYGNDGFIRKFNSAKFIEYLNTLYPFDSTVYGANGTSGYIPKYTSSNTIANSIIYDNNGKIGIGNLNTSGTLLQVGNTTTALEFDGTIDTIYLTSYNRALSQFKPLKLRSSNLQLITNGNNVFIDNKLRINTLDTFAIFNLGKGTNNKVEIDVDSTLGILTSVNRDLSLFNDLELQSRSLYFRNKGVQIGILDSTGKLGLGTVTPTDLIELKGNINLSSAGNKIKIAEGSNASIGSGTLSGGTATITTTAVTASSKIFIQYTSCSSCGSTYISAKTAGTSFVVTSTNGSDASTFDWWIIN